MAGESVVSHKQKFGCRELSKTTLSYRDFAVEANASAVGSKSGQLSVSYFRVEGDTRNGIAKAVNNRGILAARWPLASRPGPAGPKTRG